MLATTHLAVTLLLIMLLNLNRSEALVALAFGVFIDVDHLYGLGSYVRAEGIGGMTDISGMMAADVQWKSILHSPAALGIIIPLSDAFKYFLPVMFWAVHLSLDFVQQSWLGNAHPAEFAFFGLLVGLLIAVRARRIGDGIGSVRELSSFVVREANCMIRTFLSESISTLGKFRKGFSRSPNAEQPSSPSAPPRESYIFLRRR